MKKFLLLLSFLVLCLFGCQAKTDSSTPTTNPSVTLVPTEIVEPQAEALQKALLSDENKKMLEMYEFFDQGRQGTKVYYAQDVAFRFCKAFFSGDENEIKYLLANPDAPEMQEYLSWMLENHADERTSLDGFESFILRFVDYGFIEKDGEEIECVSIVIDLGIASSEAMFYFEISMIYNDGVWKVSEFGIDT